MTQCIAGDEAAIVQLAKMSADMTDRVQMLTRRLSETNDRLHHLGRLAKWMPDTEFQAEQHELHALHDRDRNDRALLALTKCIAGDPFC